MTEEMDQASSAIPPRILAPTQLPRRDTNAKAIYRDLWDKIVSLELTPGAPLPEKFLSQHYGVSRTPIREALLRLADDRLVDILPQSGTYVARIPIAAIPEAVVIRQALEGATVELAATMANARQITRMQAVIEQQKVYAQADDVRAFYDADEAFHQTIAEAAQCPNIWPILRLAKVQVDRTRRISLQTIRRLRPTIEEHERILSAIIDRDVPRARAEIARHIGAVVPDVETLRGQYPDYFI
jgi:DNA-binding GntR family transcriptional regulator